MRYGWVMYTVPISAALVNSVSTESSAVESHGRRY